MYDFAYGWPMLGLSMSYTTFHGIMTGRVMFSEFRGAIPGLEFPIRIIPLGFLVNTVFYALLSGVVVAALAHVRQIVRDRRQPQAKLVDA